MMLFIKAIREPDENADQEGAPDQEDHDRDWRSLQFAVLNAIVQRDGRIYFIDVESIFFRRDHV